MNADSPITPDARRPGTAGGLALLAARLLLAGVFSFAAVTKLDQPDQFARAIEKFRWTTPGDHDHLVKFLAFAIPWTELACAAALVLGVWTRSAALVLGGLLGTFTWAIVGVLRRGETFKCSCFGRLRLACPEELSTCNLYQNGALIALALAVLLLGGGRFSMDRLLRRRSEPTVSA